MGRKLKGTVDCGSRRVRRRPPEQLDLSSVIPDCPAPVVTRAVQKVKVAKYGGVELRSPR